MLKFGRKARGLDVREGAGGFSVSIGLLAKRAGVGCNTEEKILKRG